LTALPARPAAGGRQPRRPRSGFTLLEVLVATLLMGIAVVGLLSGISASMRNAARLTEYDRAVLAARSKMDELLLDPALPRPAVIEGPFDRALLSGAEGGWRARIGLQETGPFPVIRAPVVERIELEVWWMAGGRRRTLTLESFRRSVLRPEDVGGQMPQSP